MQTEKSDLVQRICTHPIIILLALTYDRLTKLQTSWNNRMWILASQPSSSLSVSLCISRLPIVIISWNGSPRISSRLRLSTTSKWIWTIDSVMSCWVIWEHVSVIWQALIHAYHLTPKFQGFYLNFYAHQKSIFFYLFLDSFNVAGRVREVGTCVKSTIAYQYLNVIESKRLKCSMRANYWYNFSSTTASLSPGLANFFKTLSKLNPNCHKFYDLNKFCISKNYFSVEKRLSTLMID